MKLTLMLLSLMFSAAPIITAQGNDKLEIISTKEVGQIEVGGPYVGIEIHKSFPMINRISFYYPVANSIDISEDYWKRENFRIMSMGIKEGGSPKYILENEVYKATQSPYAVEFEKEKSNSRINIKYEFCKNSPAMIATITVTNISNSVVDYEVYTRYEAVLRTSHTYNLIDKAVTSVKNNGEVVKINYDNIETGNAELFFVNAGEKPNYYTSSSFAGQYKNLDEYWLNSEKEFQNIELTGSNLSKPAAAFVYKKNLNPGESITAVQIIGSVKNEESDEVINYLKENYGKEIEDYKNSVINNSVNNKIIKTGNDDFDFTSDWALAVLQTNKHYIDSDIEPMPAQAEYNFYFTHDVLLTDLAAVNFDLERVKKDLKFIIKHADSNKVIPHAYYWKDKEFKTEFAGTENWNHFWFTIVCARYLRHSNDIEYSKTLYPYVQKSIETAMKNKGEDNLMYSFRPDWWDIGNNFGPRAYMTILAVKALHEFCYLSSSLGTDISEIKKYYETAENLNKNLTDKLWNDELKYLTNIFQDGGEDKHIYMGSMLASHFNLLDEKKNNDLMTTAEKYLLDDKLGVYTLYPMDLHKLGEYMGFAGNEAGEPYYYANGGIWPHGNSWYALGLISSGQNDKAYSFIKNIMTLKGVMNSPNGQPAMYEYRISDKSNPDVYGKIDKPQFMWAGGWYLYSLYNLFGVKENDWNISFAPYTPEELEKVEFNVTVKGKLIPVTISGNGVYVSPIKYNGEELPSLVIPDDFNNPENINIEMGKLNYPVIAEINGKLIKPVYSKEKNELSFRTESFNGKKILCEIDSPFELKKINYGEETLNWQAEKTENNVYRISFSFEQNSNNDIILIQFKND